MSACVRTLVRAAVSTFESGPARRLTPREARKNKANSPAFLGWKWGFREENKPNSKPIKASLRGQLRSGVATRGMLEGQCGIMGDIGAVGASETALEWRI